MKKTLLIIILLCILACYYTSFHSWSNANSRLSLDQALEKVINKNNLLKTSIISVSIRDLNSEKLVYQKNSKLLLHPASILKALTTPVALKFLGSEYKFETKTFISNENNNFYIALSADPLFSSKDLDQLIENSLLKTDKKIFNDVILDASIIDELPWGVGWMWDDENNPLMPKYNAYNINNNIINIKISPNTDNNQPNISVKPKCNFDIQYNFDKTKDLTVQRKPWISEKGIYIEGKPKKEINIDLPTDKPKDLFSCLLNNSMKNNNMMINGLFKESKINENLIPLGKTEHSLIQVINNINKFSNNMAAETIFKLTGGKFKNTQGSTVAGIDAMKMYYNTIGAPMDNQLIVDGSGVSHNNLVQADWISMALTQISKDTIWYNYNLSLAIPGEAGTLSQRLKDLSKNFIGKTGTNAGISSIAGYLKAKSGKKYAVVIIIQNFIGSSQKAKELEDKLISLIYEY